MAHLMAQKISEPKIKNCEVSSFNECIKNGEFNRVKISENSSILIYGTILNRI